jgi:hypothetical protein
MKFAFSCLSLSVLVLSGCSSAWVVKQDASGGVIGYYDSVAPMSEVKSLVSCPETFHVTEQRQVASSAGYSLISSPSVYSDTFSYNDHATSNAPKWSVGQSDFNQLSYTCGAPRGVASQSE